MSEPRETARQIAEEVVTHDSTCRADEEHGCDCGYAGAVGHATDAIEQLVASLTAALAQAQQEKHYVTYCNHGDDDVLAVCGVRLSTWDKPLGYVFEIEQTTCPACLRQSAARTALLEAAEELELEGRKRFNAYFNEAAKIVRHRAGGPRT